MEKERNTRVKWRRERRRTRKKEMKWKEERLGNANHGSCQKKKRGKREN